MKIVYYRHENGFVPGILTDKGVIPVNNYAGKKYNDEPLSIYNLSEFAEIEKKASSEPESSMHMENLDFGPCVPKPSKIICIGLNYRKHAMESGMAIPPLPVVFSKYRNTLTAYGADVELGAVGLQFDYEVELGVVIGRKCKHVNEADALNYVLGYCVANDLSCRDLQFLSSQWLIGKSLDGFLPLGQYVVTADEVGDPQNLRLTCSLNGEQRQNSNTADMIFSVAEIISFLSRHMTLEPGDIILTGTPEGVIMGLPEKNWLKPGDVMQVEIEKLGNSINRMV